MHLDHISQIAPIAPVFSHKKSRISKVLREWHLVHSPSTSSLSLHFWYSIYCYLEESRWPCNDTVECHKKYTKRLLVLASKTPKQHKVPSSVIKISRVAVCTWFNTVFNPA